MAATARVGRAGAPARRHPLVTLDLRLPERFQPVVQAAPVRPAIAAGLRAATATVTPLLIGHLLNAPALATWASLGGFNVSLGDKGGAYRTRAATMGALALSVSFSAALAALVGRYPALAILVTFLVATSTSFARVYGNAAASIGLSTATTFVVSLAFPAVAPEAALERAAFVLVGGLWAMLLSLVLWPLRPYRPARLDVAQSYRRTALYSSHVAAAADGQAGSDLARDLQSREDRRQVREALERARATLGAMRRGRQAETGRGERLLVLLEAAEQSFVQVLSLADLLEALPADPLAAPARSAALRALAGFADTAREVALLIEEEPSRRQPPPIPWGDDAIRAAIASAPPPGAASDAGSRLLRARLEHAAALVARLRGLAAVAAETAATLEDEHPVPTPVARTGEHRMVVEEAPRSLIAPLVEGLSLRSVALRHSLRVGIVTAVAVALAAALHLHRGYWVTLTVLVVLQPYSGATWIKVVQRVAGTVLGGALAAAIAAAVHDPRGILVAVFVLAATCVAVLPINYGAFSVFLTPTFVLLAEVNAGDWHLASLRVLDTLVGGALGLAGSRLLWPSAGREYLRGQIAASLDALREYARAVVAHAGQPGRRASAALADARRHVGLAAINAETSFQWLLAEVRGSDRRVEAVMAYLTFARRLGAALTALASAADSDLAARSWLTAIAEPADAVLADLAAAVREGRAPAPVSEEEESHLEALALAAGEGDPLLAAQIDRVWRQIATLRAAVARYNGGPAAAESAAPEVVAFR